VASKPSQTIPTTNSAAMLLPGNLLMGGPPDWRFVGTVVGDAMIFV
jgi:hypothetical protein